MPEYQSSVLAQLGDALCVDSFCVTPPILMYGLAPDLNKEQGTSLSGRLDKSTGRIKGNRTFKPQDTYIHGTSSRTGLDFSSNAGTPTDDWVSPTTSKYGILYQDGSVNALFNCYTYATSATLGKYLYIIGRGKPPPGSSLTANAQYAYLELGTDSTNGKYRIEFALGRPINVQLLAKGKTDWETQAENIQNFTQLGNYEQYLENCGGFIKIWVEPEYERGVLNIEIGEGNLVAVAPKGLGSGPNPDIGELPNSGRITFYGKNGTASLEAYPVRYEPITVKRQPINLGPVSTGMAEGHTISRTAPPAGQTEEHSIGIDNEGNLTAETTVSQEETDAYGSEEMPQFHSTLIYIPARFARSPSSLFPTQYGRTVHYHEAQVWDDDRRYGHTEGTLTLQNYDGYYSTPEFSGNLACSIQGSNGRQWGQRFRGMFGVGPGKELQRWDTGSVVGGSLYDNTCKLMIPLCAEMIFDGMHLFTALWILATFAYSPDMIAFGGRGFPPYSDYTLGPILGSGTGLQPRYRYGPEAIVLDVMLDLIHDQGMQLGANQGATAPYYLYQDQNGYLHCDPYIGEFLVPVKTYSTDPGVAYDDTRVGLIQDVLNVQTSTGQIRTEATLQGIDPWTCNLLNRYVPMYHNLAKVGYRYPMLDRTARYSSDQAMAAAVPVLTKQASLSVDRYQFRSTFDPGVFAGNAIWVHDNLHLGGLRKCYITQMDTDLGLDDISQQSGTMSPVSTIVARSIEYISPF